MLASLEGDPLVPEDELDELGELGLALGLEEAPPEGDEDELELDGDEGELDGEVDDVLEPDEVLLESPRSHAARPKASATATARAESFMCPPWLGYEKRAANSAPGISP